MNSIDRQIFDTCRTVAVVGLSSNPTRPSHGVAAYLQRHGYRVIPVNPHESTVLGEPAYPDLLSIPEPVHLVNVFRRPEHVPEITAEAIRIGARALWLQQGVSHPASEALARDAGLLVVADACIMVVHRLSR